jgi:hypothetical protein
MIAFLILSFFFLGTYWYLNGSVKETERGYMEAIAISHAKFVMDTLMFQFPWRCIRQGNPGRFEDPKGVPAVETLLQSALPRMFGTGAVGSAGGPSSGDGIITHAKGFLMRVRLKVVDVDSVEFGANGKFFKSHELTPADADGRNSLVKKLILQVRWSLQKGRDPNDDPHPQDLFLVAFKSDLEG